MFDELGKYKQHNNFLFNAHDCLRDVCNAPANKSGIYIVYTEQLGQSELIYIGRSGKVSRDGTMFIRKAGLGGLKDRLVNGHQFGKTPRRISWPNQMKLEDIQTLNVHWYITHDDNCFDCPRVIENKLLGYYLCFNGCLPRWNKEL